MKNIKCKTITKVLHYGAYNIHYKNNVLDTITFHIASTASNCLKGVTISLAMLIMLTFIYLFWIEIWKEFHHRALNEEHCITIGNCCREKLFLSGSFYGPRIPSPRQSYHMMKCSRTQGSPTNCRRSYIEVTSSWYTKKPKCIDAVWRRFELDNNESSASY